MTVPYLSCTRTYTLRVFVMQANWQMTNGFVDQNVTPHSATFDLTMPACRDAATTVVALTCAQGGSCAIGDTGPGGGIVFYVQADGATFNCGVALTSTCKYLEAAPTDHPTQIAWCSDTTSALGTTATAVGTGMANTTTADGTCTSGAIQTAADYTNNGKTDWHLPSKDELNQMCKWQRGVAWTSDATVCTGGTLNSGRGAGGFSLALYWSSSEVAADKASDQTFGGGNLGLNTKNLISSVRPVRAF